jgi:hypothetical protein
MAFTQADLTSIEAAMIALAAGSRVVSVTLGDHTTQFGAAQMDELIKLRDAIKSDVNTAAGRPAFILTQSSKGL